MSRRTRKFAFQGGAMLATGLLLACLSGGVAAASPEMSSASFRLRGATISGSGGIDHWSTAGSPTVGNLRSIGAQPGTIGFSDGLVSGDIQEGGFYPAMRYVPEAAEWMLLASGLLLLGRLGRVRGTPLA